MRTGMVTIQANVTKTLVTNSEMGSLSPPSNQDQGDEKIG